MIRNSERPDCWMIASVARCSASRRVRLKSSSIPCTAFIGVRISWLIVARNVLLA